MVMLFMLVGLAALAVAALRWGTDSRYNLDNPDWEYQRS